MHKLLSLILCLSLFSTSATAKFKSDSVRVFTDENPLVYVDSWNLWPYSYLNDEGEPEGYNIDLVGLIMAKLHIPYVIKLKSQQEALQDLKNRKADLTLTLTTGYHDGYGQYSRNVITLLTQSVATPKSKSVQIRNFRDLSIPGQQVIVSDSSLCHHLMLDYGWGDHAVVSFDIKEALSKLSSKREGQIVWNTLSLKWLIEHYHISNVEITPVNMPHGEYRFMTNNQKLLDKIDNAYANLNVSNHITQLQGKWFYPDHKADKSAGWVRYLSLTAILMLAAAIIYIVIYHLQNKRTTATSHKLNRRMALIIETSKVRIWTYDVIRNEFAWHSENGQVAFTYKMEEFASRYSRADFEQLKKAIDRLVSQHKDPKGHAEEHVTLELKAKDTEGGDSELHDFTIVLSVLRRDKQGKPTVIIGTKKDMTAAHGRQILADERTLRYWSIFYSDDAPLFEFDAEGYIKNVNPAAGRIFHFDADALIKEHIHLNNFFKTDFSDLRDADGFHNIMDVDDKRVVYRMKTVFNDDQRLLSIFVFCKQMQ